MDGMAGSGSAGGPGGFLRPIGASPSPTPTAPGELLWPANKFPSADLAANWQAAPIVAYPRRAWSPQFYSVGFLGEFVQATAPAAGGGPGLTWKDIDLAPYLPADALPAKIAPNQGNALPGVTTRRELEELVALVEYRPAVMAEAMAQREGFLTFWRGILTFTRTSHPVTLDLAFIAFQVGHFQVQYQKQKFNRARPSHLCPALMPPIDPPGHAAFPSGHATESALITACLKEVMPAEAAGALDNLAERVGRNREVLGLHYPSDSAAGRVLAAHSFDVMKSCPSIKPMMRDAAKEWQ
jgi:membrane-associated phospholipid phosphatase